jgi:hypothetical protein
MDLKMNDLIDGLQEQTWKDVFDLYKQPVQIPRCVCTSHAKSKGDFFRKEFHRSAVIE